MSCSLQPSYRFCAYSDNFTLVEMFWKAIVWEHHTSWRSFWGYIVIRGAAISKSSKRWTIDSLICWSFVTKRGNQNNLTKPWLRHPWFSKLCLFATVAFCYIIFPITLIDKNLIKTSLTSPKDWTSTPSSTKYLNSDSDWMKAENE